MTKKCNITQLAKLYCIFQWRSKEGEQVGSSGPECSLRAQSFKNAFLSRNLAQICLKMRY